MLMDLFICYLNRCRHVCTWRESLFPKYDWARDQSDMGTNEFSTEVTIQGCSMAAVTSTICLQKDACWQYWETLQWLPCHHWKGWINFSFTIHACMGILNFMHTCMMQGHNAFTCRFTCFLHILLYQCKDQMITYSNIL